MGEILNGDGTDENLFNLEVQDGIKADLDDQSLRLSSVVAEEKFEAVIGKFPGGSSSSSSSSDNETVVVPEEEEEAEVGYEKEENGLSDPIMEEEEVVEIRTTQVSEELEVAEEAITLDAAREETIDEVIPEHELAESEVNGFAEEEKEIIISDERVELVEMELPDVVEENPVEELGQEVLTAVVETKEVEYVDQAGTDAPLPDGKDEDKLPAIAESSNGTKDSNQAEMPESNGKPHIISISARTVQPTSWIGCCGLLDVFRGGR